MVHDGLVRPSSWQHCCRFYEELVVFFLARCSKRARFILFCCDESCELRKTRSTANIYKYTILSVFGFNDSLSLSQPTNRTFTALDQERATFVD